MLTTDSGSQQFDTLRAAFLADPALRQETEWAYRLAVETYNPSDRGLRFITGGIGEWIITLVAYKAGIVTLPEGHNADGHDTVELLGLSRALWSVKTSYQPFSGSGTFTITNGQNGPGAGLVVPTIFLSPGLPGITYVHPERHTDVTAEVFAARDSTKLHKAVLRSHGHLHPECVIPFEMPVNPGSTVRDPALEAVRILLDGPQFPRLRLLFQDVTARSNVSLVTQLKDLGSMLAAGQLTKEQYDAAVTKVTGAAGST